MSHTYVTPLKLEIRTSRLFFLIHLLLYALASISLMTLPWPVVFQCVCIALLIYIARKSYCVHNRLRLLIWKQEEHWELWQSGAMTMLQLQGSSFVSSWFIILNFKSVDGAGISLVIFSDAVEYQLFRQLRVRLKVEGKKSIRHDKIQL